MLVDKPELEKLSAEATPAVVAGLETGVEFGNSDRSTFEQNFTQTLHRSILTRNCIEKPEKKVSLLGLYGLTAIRPYGRKIKLGGGVVKSVGRVAVGGWAGEPE